VNLLIFIHVFSSIILACSVLYILVNQIKIYAINKKKCKIFSEELKTSFYIDAVIFLMIFTTCASGFLLINAKNLSFSTPWIDAAFLSLSFILIFSLINMILKIRLKDNTKKALKISIIFYLIIFLLIILISRDAIMKSTYLWPFY